MKQVIIVILCCFSQPVLAQNNDIFNGGPGDGLANQSFLQSSVNIYNGGQQDGWHHAGFSQTANNIFSGGSQDGWSFSSFAQAGNNLFNGGAGDGWSFLNFEQPGNLIFQGGSGDGWSGTLYPLGPLPVTWFSFTAEKQGSRAILNWQTQSEQNTSMFEIERQGAGQASFTKIGQISAAGNSSLWRSYNFVDEHPAQSVNYYRIRQFDKDGRFSYSAVRVVDFSKKAADFVLHPVPTMQYLNIRLPQNLAENRVLLQVVDVSGKVVLRHQSNALINPIILNVEKLAAGIYYLQIQDKEIKLIGRFLKE